MPVCTHTFLKRDNGEAMPESDSIIYLGGLVSNDGRVDSELSRRIGSASAEFRKVKQVWNHANLSRQRKLEIFQAFVISRLQYGLCTSWLVKTQQRRLDGFHARCLRRILGYRLNTYQGSQMLISLQGPTPPLSLIRSAANSCGFCAAWAFSFLLLEVACWAISWK